MTLTFSQSALWKRYRDHSRRQRGACKRDRLVTSHVNIYFCNRPLQKSSFENIAIVSIFLLCIALESKYIFSAVNYRAVNKAWCCRAYANINLRRRSRSELILRNLPSITVNVMKKSALHYGKGYVEICPSLR